MSLTCTCPVPTAIGDIGTITCPENVGQVQRLAFVRHAPATNHFDNAAAIIVAASWTTLLSAADSTHVAVTPFIENPTFEPGKEITIGSGNEVRNGIPKIVGTEPTKFTCTLREYPASVIRALKQLMCESNLAVYMVQEDGYLVSTTDVGLTILYPIPIQSLVVTDKKVGGFNMLDEHTLSFQLKDGWSDYLVITNPLANFNPLEW